MAQNFTDMMKLLPDVDNLLLSDETKLTQARTYYDSMTKDQQKYVSADAVTKLTDLEARMKKLKEIAGTTDSTDTTDETDTKGTTEATA